MLPQAFCGLAQYSQFVPVKVVQKGDRLEKYPLDFRTMTAGNAHDVDLWMDYESAITYSPHVGFVLTERDPFWFLDIDHCLQGGQWSPIAIELCQRLYGCAVEISISGRGLHIVGKGTVPPVMCKNTELGIELYTKSRFFLLGNRGNERGNVLHDATDAITSIAQQYFQPKQTSTEPTNSFAWTTKPVDEWLGLTDDEELITRACRTDSKQSAWGNKASFAALWTADHNVLSIQFPSINSEKPFDYSSADAALAQHLAFWTGKHCERIDKLMRKSSLMRDKYDRPYGDGSTYLSRTIINACKKQKNVYTSKRVEQSLAVSTDSASPVTVEPRTGSKFMMPDEQAKFFSGMIYVHDLDKILLPNGEWSNEHRFNSMFGGHLFSLDEQGVKFTKSAWQAYTQNTAIKFPKAMGFEFEPLKAPLSIRMDPNGKSIVNIYMPAITPLTQGNPAPFLTHIGNLFTNDIDQMIILSYLSAIVQFKGHKFRWWPIIQGAKGNGKTLISKIMTEIIGDKYTFWPRISDVSDRFNSWLVGKILICLDDAHIPKGLERHELVDRLNTLISNDIAPIEQKYADVISTRQCANGIISTNHKELLPQDVNERRFCTMFTAQQSMNDIVECGMGPDSEYFLKLHQWLNAGGVGIIHNFLANFQIKDSLNPATSCMRAPKSSSCEEVFKINRSPQQQIINEAIECGELGFRGGFVSSTYLDAMIRKYYQRITKPKQREIIESMGYVAHPILEDGVCHISIRPDGVRSRLYVLPDHHTCGNLNRPMEVILAYEAAQRDDGL